MKPRDRLLIHCMCFGIRIELLIQLDLDAGDEEVRNAAAIMRWKGLISNKCRYRMGLQYEKSPSRTLMPAGGLFAFDDDVIHEHNWKILFLAQQIGTVPPVGCDDRLEKLLLLKKIDKAGKMTITGDDDHLFRSRLIHIPNGTQDKFRIDIPFRFSRLHDSFLEDQRVSGLSEVFIELFVLRNVSDEQICSCDAILPQQQLSEFAVVDLLPKTPDPHMQIGAINVGNIAVPVRCITHKKRMDSKKYIIPSQTSPQTLPLLSA